MQVVLISPAIQYYVHLVIFPQILTLSYFIVHHFFHSTKVCQEIYTPAGAESGPAEGCGAAPDSSAETGDAITRLLTRLIAGLNWVIAVSLPSISKQSATKKRKKQCHCSHVSHSHPLKKNWTRILNCWYIFKNAKTHEPERSIILRILNYWIEITDKKILVLLNY